MPLDAALITIGLVDACVIIMIGFFYLIGRFYQTKFGIPTGYRAFLVPVVAFVAFIVAAILGVYPYEAALLSNAISFSVLAYFGLRLYGMMRGVSK
jgi:hypothetical protein